METKLDYISGKALIPRGCFSISPSSIYAFFDKPHQWYREQVLGESIFEGNTSTIIGTIVHFCAEEFSNKGKVDKNEIYKYIYKNIVIGSNINTIEWSAVLKSNDEHKIKEYILKNSNNPLYDTVKIFNQFKPMGQSIINYIIENGKPTVTEDRIFTNVKDICYIAGTSDALYGSGQHYTLIDYKTTSDLTPKKYIPLQYKYQLLAYSWIYKKLGINISTIGIVWITQDNSNRISEKTGKPLPSKPSTCYKVTENITPNDFIFIESILILISDTVLKAKEDPSLIYLLFKDMRLKEQINKIFKQN